MTMDDLAYQIEQVTKDLPLPCFFGLFAVLAAVIGIGMWLTKKKKKSEENNDE